MLKKVLFSVLLISALLGERIAEINLNDQDVELKFRNPVYLNLNPYNGIESKYYIEASFLHSSSKQNNDTLYSFGFLSRSAAPSIQNLEASLGIKGVYSGSTGSNNFFATPLGVTLQYKMPSQIGNIGLSADLYYAPSVLSFSDADGYLETRVEASFEVIKNSDVFVGFRSIDTDYDNAVGNKKFNESFYLGFRMYF